MIRPIALAALLVAGTARADPPPAADAPVAVILIVHGEQTAPIQCELKTADESTTKRNLALVVVASVIAGFAFGYGAAVLSNSHPNRP